MEKFKESELILNQRGAVYHLDLMPDEIADVIITVGDPKRVKKVSQYFDSIDVKKKHREFKTHTGWLNGTRISVISTGIGTDNIDIVFNELDALVNIDLKSRTEKEEKKSLSFIRIGTSGGLREEIEVDSYIANTAAIGIEGLGLYYGRKDDELTSKIDNCLIPLYQARADLGLIDQVAKRMKKGVALTAAGFYAPQGRSLRLKVSHETFLDQLKELTIDDVVVTNMEMETSGIYLMAELLGHKALSINTILANRVTGEFSSAPGESVDRLIRKVLQELTQD